MCTVLFLQGPPGHFILAGNRDEMRTRDRALPPVVDARGQYRLIYPVDATAGGTWMGANTHGMVATLLNHYQDAQHYQPVAPYKRAVSWSGRSCRARRLRRRKTS